MILGGVYFDLGYVAQVFQSVDECLAGAEDNNLVIDLEYTKRITRYLKTCSLEKFYLANDCLDAVGVVDTQLDNMHSIRLTAKNVDVALA